MALGPFDPHGLGQGLLDRAGDDLGREAGVGQMERERLGGAGSLVFFDDEV